MKYIDWVDLVCRSFAAARSSSDNLLGWRELVERMQLPPEAGNAVADAVQDLTDVGMLDGSDISWIKDNQNTRAVRAGASIRDLWPTLTSVSLDEEQLAFLVAAVALAEVDEGQWSLMGEVEARDVFAELGWSERDHSAYDLPHSLDDIGLVTHTPMMGGSSRVRPTYRGVVRATQRVNTQWQSRIESMVDEWETTTVEFKELLPLGSEKAKAEFAHDIIALANTKASGRDRYLVIGFSDKSKTFTTPVDASIEQNRLEQILNEYAEPAPSIRFFTVEHASGSGAIGVVEVRRDPTKVPHRMERGGGKIVAGKVYVRHGSQVEEPTPDELLALEAEGAAARSGS